MRFADIPGNTAAKKALAGMVDNGRIAHAVLFFENEGCGAFPLVTAFLQYLMCTDRRDGDSCGECPECRKISKFIHPDVHFIFPTNTGTKCPSSFAVKDATSAYYVNYFRECAAANPYFIESDLQDAIGIDRKVGAISVSEAKYIVDNMSMTSVEGGYKAVVMFQPEKMGAQTANKLLKIIEEPPEKTLFLMITHDPENVMQTILSRCQMMRVLPLTDNEVADYLTDRCSVDFDTAEKAAPLSRGSIGKALEILSESEDRAMFSEIFHKLVESSLASDLMGAQEAADSLSAMGSREKQKAFFVYASEGLRNIFALQNSLDHLFLGTDQEFQWLRTVVPGIRRNFPSRAEGLIDRTVMLLERNVNQKILFCDFVNRIFVNIR